MSIATRTAGPIGPAALRAATEAVAMDLPVPPSPVVVIDLTRVADRFRELQALLPWMDVRFDVSALAHPALLTALAADGAGFVVSHDAGLPVLQRSVPDARDVLHATPGARWPRRRSAWEAGVRRFVVDDARDLDEFVMAPAGVAVVLRLRPDDAVEAARYARALGVRVAGLSLRVPRAAGDEQLLDAVQSAVVASGRIAGILGERLELLDLGEALSGPMAGPSAHVAALGRSIRGLVAPATSRMAVIASAGRSVTTDAITIVSGTAERYADAATASEYIDAGAEVLVLRRRRRILRPVRARSTWTPAG
jgi:diaminopimelate decarboxylase